VPGSDFLSGIEINRNIAGSSEIFRVRDYSTGHCATDFHRLPFSSALVKGLSDKRFVRAKPATEDPIADTGHGLRTLQNDSPLQRPKILPTNK